MVKLKFAKKYNTAVTQYAMHLYVTCTVSYALSPFVSHLFALFKDWFLLGHWAAIHCDLNTSNSDKDVKFTNDATPWLVAHRLNLYPKSA